MSSRIYVALVAGFCLAGGIQGQEPPVTFSPGEVASMAGVGSHCPTFSWAARPGVEAVDLVVYRLGATGEEETAVVLRRRFEGPTGSWTPNLDQCLEWGEPYAWSARSTVAAVSSEWSEPRLFEVQAPAGFQPVRSMGRVHRDPAARTASVAADRLGTLARPSSEDPVESRAVTRVSSQGIAPVESGDAAIRGVGSDNDRSIGVAGRTDASGSGVQAAGVFGEQTDPDAVEAFGVYGRAVAGDGVGVVGVNESTGLAGVPIGVLGIQSGGGEGAGVFGEGFIGVVGEGAVGVQGIGSAAGTGGSFVAASANDIAISASGTGPLTFLVLGNGDVFTSGGVSAASFSMSAFDSVVDSFQAAGANANSPACSANDVMTGGGCECGGGNVLKSYPQTDTWRCECSAGIAKAYVVCLTSP
jgi:hypothetical protein